MPKERDSKRVTNAKKVQDFMAWARDNGYAITIWTPEELGSIRARTIEDAMTSAGADMISWETPKNAQH